MHSACASANGGGLFDLNPPAGCLLANANSGGDNVHRLVLGALVGADCGASRIPSELKRGLAHAEATEREICEQLRFCW